MPEKKNTRRQFLTTAAGLAAVSAARPASAAPQGGRVIGANDRINMGMIGVGGRGSGHVRTLNRRAEMKGDVRIVAISDIYSKRIEAGRQLAQVEQKDVHRDYHDLLARSDVDAVFISTPDHWHAPMTLDAFEAGKDVYLEKPMTLTIPEAREVARKAKETGRVLQVGCQHTSDKSNHIARKIVEDGLIGAVLWAQSTYSRNSVYGEWNYRIDEDATAEDVGWEQFLGPAPDRPFDPDRYFRWRKYWDYSGGIATDLFYHTVSPILMAVGPEFPLRITASGGIYIQKDREVPDTFFMNVDYPSWTMQLACSVTSGKGAPLVFHGSEGTIIVAEDSESFGNTEMVVIPDRDYKDDFVKKTGKEELRIEVTPFVRGEHPHMDNFLESMRTRQKPNLDADLGYRAMAAIGGGVTAYRKGKVVGFDSKSEKLT